MTITTYPLFGLVSTTFVLLLILLLSSSSSSSLFTHAFVSKLDANIKKTITSLKKEITDFHDKHNNNNNNDYDGSRLEANELETMRRKRLETMKNSDEKYNQRQEQESSRSHSLTGRLSVDYDLSRMREGAVGAHSFMPPLLQNNDQMFRGGLVSAADGDAHVGLAHWDLSLGSAVASDKYVRLTPAQQDRCGIMWNSVPMHHIRSWTAHIGFRIHNPLSPRKGADGMAFWYQMKPQWIQSAARGRGRKTAESGAGGVGAGGDRENEGPVLGLKNEDMTDGFGIIFDTFDNDGGNDNPAVYFIRTQDSNKRKFLKMSDDRYRGADDQVINDDNNNNNNNADGSRAARSQSNDDRKFRQGIDHDPETDYKATRVGQCFRRFRNTPEIENVVVKYDATEKTLLVAFSDQHCMFLDDIVLPMGGYFGFSAHTGGAVDNHDVHYFILLSNDDDIQEQKKRKQGVPGSQPPRKEFDQESEVAEKKKWTDFDEGRIATADGAINDEKKKKEEQNDPSSSSSSKVDSRSLSADDKGQQ